MALNYAMDEKIIYWSSRQRITSNQLNIINWRRQKKLHKLNPDIFGYSRFGGFISIYGRFSNRTWFYSLNILSYTVICSRIWLKARLKGSMNFPKGHEGNKYFSAWFSQRERGKSGYTVKCNDNRTTLSIELYLSRINAENLIKIWLMTLMFVFNTYSVKYENKNSSAIKILNRSEIFVI